MGSALRPSARVHVCVRLLLALAAAGAGAGCEPPPEGARDAGGAGGAGGGGDAGLPADGGPGPDAGGADARGGDGGRDGGADAGVAEDYAFVVLPDTQFYASSWPEIFAEQTRWIVDSRVSQRIAFVLHTGDVVDGDIPVQWTPAAQALHTLDGELPYIITAGNHDYFDFADRMGLINSYFPPAHFAQYPWFGGTFEPGHTENSFSVVQVPGGARWLVIALEFGPRDEALAWAGQVLGLFRDTPAIIITHAYLYRDGTRYDHLRGRQQFNPHGYVMMGQPGTTVNDGEEMWRKLVMPNRNVKLVFCGHDVDEFGPLPPGTAARLTSTRADGSRVHQILANYQSCTGGTCEFNIAGMPVHGGNGFLRVVRVSPAARTMSVTTYSPSLDQYLVDPANQFSLDLDP